jgi:hypothetical protein
MPGGCRRVRGASAAGLALSSPGGAAGLLPPSRCRALWESATAFRGAGVGDPDGGLGRRHRLNPPVILADGCRRVTNRSRPVCVEVGEPVQRREAAETPGDANTGSTQRTACHASDRVPPPHDVCVSYSCPAAWMGLGGVPPTDRADQAWRTILASSLSAARASRHDGPS